MEKREEHKWNGGWEVGEEKWEIKEVQELEKKDKESEWRGRGNKRRTGAGTETRTGRKRERGEKGGGREHSRKKGRVL